MRRLLIWLLVVMAMGLGAIAVAYFRDMGRAYERIRGRSKVIPSPYGDIEYTEGGTGTAVLVIHGSGGGFDQGELIARALLGDGVHWIAPSRFGYLRSTYKAGASFDDQAQAYAHLLDHLGIGSCAVICISHGGPSALLFAAQHPARVTSLTLISAGVASTKDPGQLQANRQGDLLMTIFKHDVWYWGITKAFPKKFMAIMGADEAVADALSLEQRALAGQVIAFMNPVSPRSAGAAFDNQAAMPNERIGAIRTPTLIFHAKDDTLQIYRNAEFAAATIPGARLVAFERGGHLVMVVEQSKIRTMMMGHILGHAAN